MRVRNWLQSKAINSMKSRQGISIRTFYHSIADYYYKDITFNQILLSRNQIEHRRSVALVRTLIELL